MLVWHLEVYILLSALSRKLGELTCMCLFFWVMLALSRKLRLFSVKWNILKSTDTAGKLGDGICGKPIGSKPIRSKV